MLKRNLLTLIALALISCHICSQESHLSLVYDFEGEDFDHAVNGMVGTNDSLYIIGNTPNGQGLLFRIDKNGEGRQVIWDFDDINFAPNSIIANDTVIYGTTRFSNNGGGTLFEYNLKDYTFQFIKDFSPDNVQDAQVKYITDTVLWMNSQHSFVDKGSIFTIEKDGSELTKIYNDTDMDKGQNPVDFVFHNDSIYIACFNGGGIPYDDGIGGTVASGSFIRVKYDGTGYQKILQGQDGVGTQPQSIIIREDRLIGLFAYSGSTAQTGGQFFSCELNGADYKSLGALKGRALTSMLSADSLIYGISSSEVFGVNPYTEEIRIFDDLQSNVDFGYDVVSTPAILNDTVYIAAQQGGPERGGTILKWINKDPVINAAESQLKSLSDDIDLSVLFTDPEGDPISYSYESETDGVVFTESNGILNVKYPENEEVKVKVTANDGWVGYNSIVFAYNVIQSVSEVDLNHHKINIYPNPTNGLLYFKHKNIDKVDIVALNGQLILTIDRPVNELDISNIPKGVYVLRCLVGGKYHVQKIIKN